MARKTFHLGIDLGTTNSAAAVFDGEAVSLIRTPDGGTLTPSVVRMDARGNVTVGARARRFLENDTGNTRAEFKRLMGTQATLAFASCGAQKKPQELAALVLRSIRKDVEEQLGFAPTTAVVTVPALFELPQSSATAEAGRLAGFEKVELIQEPVASALAAGWTRDDGDGRWLVYDLGGGTFDASLLETRDGMLRVVGHDGDNFLGGRDIDNAIVDWVLEQVAASGGPRLTRGEEKHAAAMRRLKLAAEEAKMELGRAPEAPIALPAWLEVEGRSVDVDVVLTRDALEQVTVPLVERSIQVCKRLLEQHRTVKLARVVMVGGPTVMPFLRRMVKEALEAPLAEGVDPMTVVAQGAALYAATLNLVANPGGEDQGARGRKIWLKYPAVSSDLAPYVVGRVLDEPADSPAPARIRLLRAEPPWESPWVAVSEDDKSFVCAVELAPRRTNLVRVEAQDASGAAVEVQPSSFTMVQGVTITDPPLSRSIGVALANDTVRIYLEKGTPLPARRTVSHHAVESVAQGHADSVLRIPVVQGEYRAAHLNRMVGALDVKGQLLKGSLPAGARIEVTLEVDRGGRLTASALLPDLGQTFDEVAHLVLPEADMEGLSRALEEMARKLADARREALKQGATSALARLNAPEKLLQEARRDVEAARGKDADAAQKARRTLQELDAFLDKLEQEERWPELDEEARGLLAWAAHWISEYGTPTEKNLFKDVERGIETARAHKQPLELERQMRVASDLGHAAFYRQPGVWENLFEDAQAEVERCTDVPRAQQLVKDGHRALQRNDEGALRDVVRNLWRLMPPDVADRRKGYDSGVR